MIVSTKAKVNTSPEEYQIKEQASGEILSDSTDRANKQSAQPSIK